MYFAAQLYTHTQLTPINCFNSSKYLFVICFVETELARPLVGGTVCLDNSEVTYLRESSYYAAAGWLPVFLNMVPTTHVENMGSYHENTQGIHTGKHTRKYYIHMHVLVGHCKCTENFLEKHAERFFDETTF